MEIIRQEPNKEKPANDINIDEPWEQWIITNEHNLPYPIGKQSESTYAEIFNSEEIRQQLLGKEAASKNKEGVVTKWSDEQIGIALEEAIKRQASTFTDVVSKIIMNDQGLVTVLFNRDVVFPSYLLELYDGS